MITRFSQPNTHTHTSFPLLSPYDVNADFMHFTSVELLTHKNLPSNPPSLLPHLKATFYKNKGLYLLYIMHMIYAFKQMSRVKAIRLFASWIQSNSCNPTVSQLDSTLIQPLFKSFQSGWGQSAGSELQGLVVPTVSLHIHSINFLFFPLLNQTICLCNHRRANR